jgi:NAD(P)-dependent dehydrogenase (short-subunit alcohol dehydrogenase family)
VTDYSDRVVIVTGGTRGIGRGCVEVFVRAGAHVVFCSHEPDNGAELSASVTSRGPGRADFALCDVADLDALTALVTGTAARLGRLDCLINNAGWHPPHKPIDDFTVDEFEALMRLNVTSVFVGCRAALPFLRTSRGSIINIASLVATIGQYHATTYVASKGAVLSFTKALAIDEARHGVRVNAVSPGNIDTPLWQQAVDQSPDPRRTREDGERAQPMGRMGTAEEVARLCLFLAAEATFTTGVDCVISGAAELGYGRKSHDPL